MAKSGPHDMSLTQQHVSQSDVELCAAMPCLSALQLCGLQVYLQLVWDLSIRNGTAGVLLQHPFHHRGGV